MALVLTYPTHLRAQLQESVTDTLRVKVIGSEQCVDGIDNDGDGDIDFPDDLGCTSYDDTDETGPYIPQCSDGIDNDSDGQIDFPNDTGCDNASDDNEYVYSPPSGGGGGGGGGGDRTSVRFEGIAYPASTVTLLKNGQIVETETTDTVGFFSIRFDDVAEGQYTFAVSAVDPDKIRSITQAFTVAVIDDVTTSVDGIYIPPTITLNKSQVKAGNTLLIQGYARSSSTVALFVDTAEEMFGSTTSNTFGAWSFSLDSSKIGYGTHVVRARAYSGSYSTTYSSTLRFSVGLVDIFEEVAASCDLRGDLNGDCRVNLIDFSIAAYWYRRKDPPMHVDTNSDRIIDLKDFSIMAYYWTG